MGKSDQHKKLLERSGEKTLDFLIGAVWEGMSRKRYTQNSPYTMQASRVIIHLGVYRVKKEKNFLPFFLAKLGNFKTLLFFHQKKNIFLVGPNFQKITKNAIFSGAGLDNGFLKWKNSAFNFPFHSEVRLGDTPSNIVQIKIK